MLLAIVFLTVNTLTAWRKLASKGIRSFKIKLFQSPTKWSIEYRSITAWNQYSLFLLFFKYYHHICWFGFYGSYTVYDNDGVIGSIADEVIGRNESKKSQCYAIFVDRVCVRWVNTIFIFSLLWDLKWSMLYVRPSVVICSSSWIAVIHTYNWDFLLYPFLNGLFFSIIIISGMPESKSFVHVNPRGPVTGIVTEYEKELCAWKWLCIHSISNLEVGNYLRWFITYVSRSNWPGAYFILNVCSYVYWVHVRIHVYTLHIHMS